MVVASRSGLAPSGSLSVDPTTFMENFDKRPFYVTHGLADHPLMQLPEIAALSERLPPRLLEWNSQQSGAFVDPASVGTQPLSCCDAILSVSERPVWALLLQIEHDPQYKALVDELLDSIEPLSEQVRPGMHQREAFLFVSSRAAFTPFHFDPEYNFLLQVRGRKTVLMWDPANTKVLSPAALDNYYAGVGGDPRYSNRKQPYRDEFKDSAWELPMDAGLGVHFPLHAPHAVRTESDVSISLSITFRTKQSQFNAMVHGANGHIRRLGLHPPAPGQSKLGDVAANVGFRGTRKAAAAVRRAASPWQVCPR